ncbi:MAG: type II asparaginase [Bacteroidales bacterium]
MNKNHNPKPMLKYLLATLILFASLLSFGQTQKPVIAILATGGTIAGSAQSSVQASYNPGILSVEQIISSVPAVNEIATLEAIQVCNISSQNMEEQIWLQLWKTIDSLFANKLCDGVVITHGTDTMEETAYFLNLTVRHPNPVVLTGSMRPASALSADGPFNLYNAVALASSKEAYGKGVMVAMNDLFFCANDVTKSHTTNTAAFTCPNYGPLGQMRDGKPSFFRENLFIHTTRSQFELKGVDKLPGTEILYAYAFASDLPFYSLIEQGTKGIVIAGAGHGNYNRPFATAMEHASKKGIVVVRSTRIPSGGVDKAAEEYNSIFPVSYKKNPQKARILLMLALTQTKDTKKIQEFFEKY